MKTLLKPVFTGAIAACLMFAATGAVAQGGYPDKPINFVIPYAPGGPTDAMARTLAVALRDQLGQAVVVENKPGAGANIGAAFVARAAPDGYTMMLGTPAPLAINVSLFRKINYHPLRDFAPVIDIGTLPNVLAVHAEVPANDLEELITHARSHPVLTALPHIRSGKLKAIGVTSSTRSQVD